MQANEKNYSRLDTSRLVHMTLAGKTRKGNFISANMKLSVFLPFLTADCKKGVKFVEVNYYFPSANGCVLLEKPPQKRIQDPKQPTEAFEQCLLITTQRSER